MAAGNQRGKLDWMDLDRIGFMVVVNCRLPDGLP
jgi:hypothetical protein